MKSMPAYYDFYQTPQPKGSNKDPQFHARVVPTDTVTLDDLAELIHECSTHTVGDVVGVTSLIVEFLIRSLKQGKRVHIPKLGYFLLSASCPSICTPGEIRAESIEAKSISFRVDHEAQRELKTTTFVRVPEKRHSKKRSAEDINRLLTSYFATHPYINRRRFQGLFGLTQATAGRRLRELVEQGQLRKEGDYRQFPNYVPVEGYFEK